MMRKELHKACKTVDFDKEEDNTELLEAFNDRNISHEDFMKMVKENKNEKSLKNIRRVLSNVQGHKKRAPPSPTFLFNLKSNTMKN